MSYRIRTCPKCNKHIHIHTKHNRRFIKDSCEHIPHGYTTKAKIGEMFNQK